jgi:hypothetical protein
MPGRTTQRDEMNRMDGTKPLNAGDHTVHPMPVE